MAIVVVTDSTCDIAPEILKSKGVQYAPLKVLFQDGEYVDKQDLTNPEFYQKMKNSDVLPTTSQVNPNEFHDIFMKILQAGDTVIGLFLSSELSGTYQSAVIAKEMIGSDAIILLDSRTTSFGLGLLLQKLTAYIEMDLELDDLINRMDSHINHTQLYGMLDTLENLKKGGRLSSSSAMIGKMLNLKPIIEIVDGKVGVATKVRGGKKGMQWMLDQLAASYPEGEIDTIGIAHANAPDKLEVFKGLILQTFNVKEIHVSEIGSVVGTHTGEGALGLVYFK